MTEERKIVIREFEIPNTAFSGRRYIRQAIRFSSEEWHLISEDGVDELDRSGVNGGIIILPAGEVTSVKAGMLYELKEKYSLLGWTVGEYFSGEYNCGNGKKFNGKSCSIELLGTEAQKLNETAAKMFKRLGLEYCLLFSYNDNKLYYIDRE